MKFVVVWKKEPASTEVGEPEPAPGPDPVADLRHMLGVLGILALACLLPRCLGAAHAPVRDPPPAASGAPAIEETTHRTRPVGDGR